jgi:CheY-like chemotaxis protein
MLLYQKRIYIVEDNVRNRLIYQLTLLKHAAELFFDTRGDETLLRLKNVQQKPHLIILDLMLGTAQDGFDLGRQIRDLPGCRELPLVIISAAEPIAAMTTARTMGLSGFIAKPIDSSLFADQVSRLIAGQKVWSAGDRYVTTI